MKGKITAVEADIAGVEARIEGVKVELNVTRASPLGNTAHPQYTRLRDELEQLNALLASSENLLTQLLKTENLLLAIQQQQQASASSAEVFSPQYRRAGLPFNLEWLESLANAPSHSDWADYSYGLSFTGRMDFSSQVASKVSEIGASKPTGPSDTYALVYSSASGTGKTVSMLNLNCTLRKEPRGEEGCGGNAEGGRASDEASRFQETPVVAYLGFGCALPLDVEERDLCDKYGWSGVRRVLARRLLGAVVLSRALPDLIPTKLPPYEEVYKGRDFPTVEECKEMLKSYLCASRDKPVVVVAGVDEVQLLNTLMIIGVKKEGLGRVFLGLLRQWQQSWGDDGIRLLPLGTGILLSFPFGPSTGENEALNGTGDAVLITKDDFKKLVHHTVEDEAYASRYHVPWVVLTEMQR
uniref:Uncharacterized protein n=1 Tax=Chromera velia CCMP2878 TaxID=1169474 RepID=A0A0G4I5S4_9ALVE|eukprot:Cvel_66.t1-p1 / transcript=Cvel_66.t1 / gene=Cvel_66 / organism=Chromera_velia_CCMP2878 / gene_product=hypothetical protein / transcript_product=hypothetical protein / location=Cvel_scaffold6:112742-114373(+) / protein_length=411 / sequence_SO=supercontig / SO=protein_coding / is_pseudo=false